MNIKKQLEVLGCEEIRKGIFRHPDIGFDLDFSAIAESKVLLRLYLLFVEKGHEGCQADLKRVLGIT